MRISHRTAIVAVIVACSFFVIRAGAAPAGQTAKPTPKPAAAKPPAKHSWPAPVEAAFKKAYPNATVKNVSKETENGKVQYEVESMDGAQARDLVYLADGKLVLYEELIPQTEVPAAVMTALKAKYPKATVTRAEKLFQDGTMNYELAVKGAGQGEVILTPAGKWVSPAK
jgi:hypothetical protein